MGPLRTGFFYGLVAALIALVSDLRFLLIGPQSMSTWVLAVIETYRSSVALAATLFLGILAAMRVRPTRLDPGVPYRSLLLRDCTLAAAVVAVMAGATLFLTTALQATLLADEARSYAAEAAPRIVDYLDELAERFDNPSPATVQQVEEDLRPPTLNDLGRSITNLVLRALLVGTAGAVVGLVRGRFEAGPGEPEDAKPSGG